MKFFAAFIVAVFLPLSFAAPSDATREPVSKDRCWNVDGIQRHSTNRIRVRWQRPDECNVRVNGRWTTPEMPPPPFYVEKD